jgi:hypothetical protein
MPYLGRFDPNSRALPEIRNPEALPEKAVYKRNRTSYSQAESQAETPMMTRMLSIQMSIPVHTRLTLISGKRYAYKELERKVP